MGNKDGAAQKHASAQLRMLMVCAREIEHARQSRAAWREEIEARVLSPADGVCADFARHLIEEDDAA